MEMLETKRWDGLCRIMTIVSTVTSLLTQAPKDSPLRSFWACARLFTNIYYSKLRLCVSHTVERHHLWNRNCAGDEEPWTRKATPVLARLEYKVLELLKKKKKKFLNSNNSCWCGKMAFCERTAGWACRPYTALAAWSYSPRAKHEPRIKLLKLDLE